jgi:hypothetical protein
MISLLIFNQLLVIISFDDILNDSQYEKSN